MTVTAEPATAIQTASVTTANLRTLLAASAPFADRYPDGHPALRCIRIEAGGGVITASATDRYIAGYVRRAAAGTLGPIYLRRDDAEHLIEWLDARAKFTVDDLADHAEITVESDQIKVAIGGHAARLKARPINEYPDLGPVFDGVTGSSADGPVGLSMFVLGRLVEALTAVGKDLPARWTVGGPTSPIRVEVEDWFAALIMPVAQDGKAPWAGAGRVPFGLPVAS